MTIIPNGYDWQFVSDTLNIHQRTIFQPYMIQSIIILQSYELFADNEIMAINATSDSIDSENDENSESQRKTLNITLTMNQAMLPLQTIIQTIC